MEVLEKIWEGTGTFFSSILQGFERGLTGVFGTSNARQIKRFEYKVQQINALEEKFKAFTDEQLREQTLKFKQRLIAGETLDDILVEAFATCREGGRRFLHMRHYDVQLIGGIVLHSGLIAEMVTGEGKTLVATLPAYLNALAGKGCHVVTVNDYLARRDMEWMAPLYMGLGLTVGAIQSGLENDERQKAYACDITYATNNELGFDYLRDNMRLAARGDNRFESYLQQVQGPLNYAIIDEVDNILIDEARTPLIISGPAHQDIGKYAEADRIARQLKKEEHFVVSEKDNTVNLTDEGVRFAEKLAGVESFYTAGNMEWPHLLDNALKAHFLYQRDVRYVVKDDSIIIVDDFTGRLMEGRQWSDGLHQAVEAKEGVKIKEETQTLATITLQNFFKLYNKLSGMTGTAMTEASEFWKIYHLDVIAIPTNRRMQRIEFSDTIFLTEKEKYQAVADDIERTHKWDVLTMKDGSETFGEIVNETDSDYIVKLKETRANETIAKNSVTRVSYRGRPVLVGTVSIEKSEQISALLERRGIPHQVLNAKHHRREAEIIAQAGRMGGVTIATNMAGRGTDIILGGNPETMAWAQLQDKYATRLDVPFEEWDGLVREIEQREKMKEAGQRVREIGGLYVIGTERHESRRIDLQLRGRCGRQGDPGSSRFYLSLEDDLMRIFAGDWVRNWMEKFGGMGNGEAIENAFISRRITGAQKKVEERNFDIRKNLLEYDEVMDQQRKRIYGYRQQILEGVSCRHLVLEQIHQQIDHYVKTYTDPLFGAEAYAKFAGQKVSCQLEPRDFRNLDPQTAAAFAIDLAERSSETQILDAIEENLPETEDESEWNWEALCKWMNAKYGTSYRISDLKKIPRDQLDEHLIERAFQVLHALDLTEGATLLDEHYGVNMLIGWMRHKFGIEVELDQVKSLEPEQIKKRLIAMAEQGYRQKESEYPVMAGMMRYGQQVSETQIRLDGAGLAHWASERFEKPVTPEELTVTSLGELQEKLHSYSVANYELGTTQAAKAIAKVNEFYGGRDKSTAREIAGSNGALDSLQNWLDQDLAVKLDKDKLGTLNKEQLQRQVEQAIDDRYFPEIRRMERQLLLNIVDSSWKDHLLAMDHLRSAISLKGYAQMDPKVEYKREGMKMYGQMWFSIGERMTDLIFRMEGLDENFVSSTMKETSARHDAPPPAMEESSVTSQQVADLKAADRAGRAEEEKVEPIRNVGQRVGRNDPCPCGSGKKFKNCHMDRN